MKLATQYIIIFDNAFIILYDVIHAIILYKMYHLIYNCFNNVFIIICDVIHIIILYKIYHSIHNYSLYVM